MCSSCTHSCTSGTTHAWGRWRACGLYLASTSNIINDRGGLNRIPGHRSLSCMYAAHTFPIAVLIFSNLVVVPDILMAFLFYRLYGVLSKQSSAVQQQVTQAQSPSSPHVNRSQKKAIKLITTIMTLFLCFWIPSQLVPTLFVACNADITLLLNYFSPWFYVFWIFKPSTQHHRVCDLQPSL